MLGEREEIELDDLNNEEAQNEEEEPLLDEEELLFDKELQTTDKKGLPNWCTWIDLVKGNLGPGLLALPIAIKAGGLLVGVLGLFLLASVTLWCMHLLVNSSHELCKKTGRRRLDYGEVVEACFAAQERSRCGLCAKIIINALLCVAQIGFCTVYFVFAAKHLQQISDFVLGAERTNTNIIWYCVLFCVALLASIRSRKVLNNVNMLASAFQVIGILMIFYLLYKEDSTSEPRIYPEDPKKQLPHFFGTAVYAFEGIGVVLPCQNKMETPTDMKGKTGVLNKAMLPVLVLYGVFGICGYIVYGEDVKASITLSLPTRLGPELVVKILISSSVLLTYAIQFSVPVEIILPLVHRVMCTDNLCCRKVADFVLRYSLVAITYILARAVGDLDLYIPLVGSITSSWLALVVPAVVDTVTFWSSRTKSRLAGNLVIAFIGLLGFFIGTCDGLSNFHH